MQTHVDLGAEWMNAAACACPWHIAPHMWDIVRYVGIRIRLIAALRIRGDDRPQRMRGA
jgi:hypothetical protein